MGAADGTLANVDEDPGRPARGWGNVRGILHRTSTCLDWPDVVTGR